MLLPPVGRDYLLAALDNTPATLTALLSYLSPDSPAWDICPAPDRFRLREIVAHLADWEAIWRERFERTVSEEYPRLPRPDPDQRAAEADYTGADPVERLARFRTSRAALTEWLHGLPEDAWTRTEHMEQRGDFPLAGIVTLTLGHDSYHLRQVAEWLAQG